MFGQRLPGSFPSDFLGSFQYFFQVSVFLKKFHRGFRTDSRGTGNVVRRVTDEGQVVRNQCRRNPELLPRVGLVYPLRLNPRRAPTARIYNDLGFGQRGLLEGYNAVNADPTNFSAHRFLADTYATLPRHEIARVSELLQSQLLQPINITPIQPALAESNLFLISSQGAAQPSFNEFNPLFTSNQAVLQASGLYGSDDTWAGEGIVSGIYNGLSLSAGYTHFETDGWRENADQKDDIGNIFAQYQFTDKTSIQAEYRHRDIERGDIEQRFFQEDFNTEQRNEVTTYSGRIGLRHAFSPGSIVLGNFQYANKEDDFVNVFHFDGTFDGFPPPPDVEDIFDNPIEEDGYAGELSYLLRSKYIELVSGAGYVKQNEDITFTDTFQWPGTAPPSIPTLGRSGNGRFRDTPAPTE